MKRNLLMSATLVIGTALFVSCGGADKQTIAVPKDAAFVFHINTPSLASKLTWAEIKASEWFKELHKEADDSVAQKLLDNPESSGVNVQEPMTLFIKNSPKATYIVFEGSLKDAAAFENFYKQTNKNAVAAKEGDMNILKNRDNIVTWKNDKFIFVNSTPNVGNQFIPGASNDLSSLENRNLPVDSLVKYAKELFELKSENSLFTDKRFADLIKESGDMHLWMSAENLYGGIANNMLSMMKVGILLEGNVTAGTLNFENGKIAIKTKSYYNKELAKVYEKYKMKPIDAALLNRIPSQNVVGLTTFNYPPDGLNEFLKLIGVDGWVNTFMGEVGYSMEEFVKANKGDVLFAITDLEMKTQTMTMPNPEGGEPMVHNFSTPSWQHLFAVSINDKPAFDKMVNIVKSKLGEMPEGKMPDIKYSLNDTWFAAGSSEEQINKFLAGGNNNQPFASKLAGNPMVFWVDLQKAMKPFAADTTSKVANMVLGESLKMWEELIITGGEVKDGQMSGNFEINLVDKNTNSLKQLNQYFDKLAAAKKASEANIQAF